GSTISAFRVMTGSYTVIAAINFVQSSALLDFSVMAIGYRVNHPEGARGWTLDPNGNPINTVLKVDAKGAPLKDAKGDFVVDKNPDGTNKPFTVTYAPEAGLVTAPDPANPKETITSFQFHPNAKSVVMPHNFSYMIIQACI